MAVPHRSLRTVQIPSSALALVRGPATQEMDRASDARLVGRIRNRDCGAFELLYDRHAPAALGLACRMVADRALAEEVTQEAFISVWRSAHLYRPERGSVRTWVLGIAHHRAIDALRRRAVRERLQATQESFVERVASSDPTAAEALQRDETTAARRAVETLPGEQRSAIELAYFAGLTQTEIAAKLEVPLGTVKGRIRLGLEKLRELLDPVEPSAPVDSGPVETARPRVACAA